MMLAFDMRFTKCNKLLVIHYDSEYVYVLENQSTLTKIKPVLLEILHQNLSNKTFKFQKKKQIFYVAKKCFGHFHCEIFIVVGYLKL